MKCLSKQMHYLYAVDKSQVIALHVSERSDMHSAVLCLRKAKYIAGKPEIIVTDGWYAYPKAIRKVFGRRKPRVKHGFRNYFISNNKR